MKKISSTRFPSNKDSVKQQILSENVDLTDLFEKYPELFNLNRISVDKLAFLYSNWQDKFTAIEKHMAAKSVNERCEFFSHLDTARARKTFSQHISDADVDMADPANLIKLLEGDFKKFATPARFAKLGIRHQGNLYAEHSEWCKKNKITVDLQRLSKKNISRMTYKDPECFDGVEDLSNISMCDYSWDYLIKKNPENLKKFIKNTKSCSTKSEVRNVVSRNPSVIKLLNEDIIADSKLSVKEWILLIKQIMEKHSKLFEGWDFDENFKYILKLDAMSEILSGPATSTQRYRRSIGKVLGSDEDNEDEEES